MHAYRLPISDPSSEFYAKMAWCVGDMTLEGICAQQDLHAFRAASHVFFGENRDRYFAFYLFAHSTVALTVCAYCETEEEIENVFSHTALRLAAVATTYLIACSYQFFSKK